MTTPDLSDVLQMLVGTEEAVRDSRAIFERTANTISASHRRLSRLESDNVENRRALDQLTQDAA